MIFVTEVLHVHEDYKPFGNGRPFTFPCNLLHATHA